MSRLSLQVLVTFDHQYYEKEERQTQLAIPPSIAQLFTSFVKHKNSHFLTTHFGNDLECLYLRIVLQIKLCLEINTTQATLYKMHIKSVNKTLYKYN